MEREVNEHGAILTETEAAEIGRKLSRVCSDHVDDVIQLCKSHIALASRLAEVERESQSTYDQAAAQYQRAEEAEDKLAAAQATMGEMRNRLTLVDLTESQFMEQRKISEDQLSAMTDQRDHERALRLTVEARESDLRPEVREFAWSMETRLKANDYKGGWKDCRTSYLIERLDEESKELRSTMFGNDKKPSMILSEAADVANFAMMLADVSGRLLLATPASDRAGTAE